MSALRSDVLAGVAVAVVGAESDRLGGALVALGARVAGPDEPLGADEERVGEWAAAEGPLGGLVFVADAGFGGGGSAALAAALDDAWASAREVANRLIAEERPGKIVFIAPRTDAGPLAAAAHAALENLARTLSVEWARYGITTCAVLPGAASTEAEVGELVAYLLSPAGEYFSGCALRVGLVTL